MWAKLASFIIRKRVVLLIIIGILTVFMGYEASKVQLSYDWAKVIPVTDQEYVEYINFKQQFGEDGNVLVIGVKDTRLFQLDFFNSWAKLATDIEKIDGIQNVVSISNLYNLERNDSLKKFVVTPLVGKIPSRQTELDSIRELVLNTPIYKGLIYNLDSNVTLLAITMVKSKLDSKERIGIVAQIEEKARKFASDYKTDVHFSGLPYIRTVFSTKVANELKFFTLLAIGITGLFLLIFFQSFYAVVFSMLVVIVTVIWTMASIQLLGYKIALLTGLIPPLIVVIAIQNCIYLINVYHFEFRAHRNKMKALNRVISKIGLASFLTNATTAVGFGVFSFSGSQVLDEFSIISSLNIMVVYFLSTLMIPTIFSFLPSPNERQLKHLNRKTLAGFLNFINKVVFNYRPWVYGITAIMLLGIFIGIYKIETIGYMVDDIPQKDPVYMDLKFFEKNFDGVMPLEIVVDTKKDNGVKKLETLQKIDRLQRSLATYPELAKPLSITELVKYANQAYYGGNPKRYIMPNVLDMGNIISYLPKQDGNMKIMKSLVDSNYRMARISVQMADIGSVRMNQLKTEIRNKVDSIFDPGVYDVRITGTSVISYKGNDYLVENLIQGLIWALIIITLMMAALFFSWRMILISLIPNLIPLVITLGLMGYFGIRLKNSTILVFSVAYGIVVDLTIHFLAKYRIELRKRDWKIGESVEHSLEESGFSMIYTTVILFFGFIIFAFSSFGGTVALGILTSICLVIGLFTNLFLLPSMLLSLEKRMNMKKELGSSIIEIEDETSTTEDETTTG